MIKKLFTILALSTLLTSCGEEILTQNTLSETFGAPDLESFHYNTCSAMRFVKPPVDILFVVDNSGSTLQSSFTAIKEQIAATVSTISNEFDYHVYIAPLKPSSGDSISNYPLIVSDPTPFVEENPTAYNIVQIEEISSSVFFSEALGGNTEQGFKRVHDLINENRNNNIFRSNANTIAVMISNYDDTDTVKKVNGQASYNNTEFNNKKNQFINLKQNLNAKSFRFISLTPHSSCNGWNYHGGESRYKKMSQDLYSLFGHSDDSSYKHARDLCSGNYATLFKSVNESIRHERVGHKYDHWKISSADESSIQANDIVVMKVSQDGSKKVEVPVGTSNGFEYLGYKQGINTRYAPDAGEPVTGLVIKLNGSARVDYPDCITAKTRTPTEYFGYAVMPREPQVGTIKVEINGKTIENSSTNGWSYEGFQPSKNVKVPGPTDAPTTPELLKSGYFIKLNGSAIITNGDDINVYYKPMAI
ncbi:MAG: VWA domain-containing protein [Bacteriovoracaceae bacterium]|nr:VWA domain-containing protein [Bacteriovoracaceae bacterium]